MNRAAWRGALRRAHLQAVAADHLRRRLNTAKRRRVLMKNVFIGSKKNKWPKQMRPVIKALRRYAKYTRRANRLAAQLPRTHAGSPNP